jgi:hypothetical protein
MGVTKYPGMDRPVLLKQELESMTAEERIALIRVKVERAEHHVIDLERAIRAFLDSDPYRVGSKREAKKLIYYAANVEPVPPVIAAVAGDAIHNLRSVLDHLAVHLFFVGPNRAAGPSKHDAFYIADDSKEFESRLNGVIQDLRPDAADALRSIEPYKGGKGHRLWILHRLDIIDKHRLLMTIASTLKSVSIVHKNTPNVLPTPLSQTKKFLPLKAGDELLIGYGQIAENMQFAFDVALNEPGILECESLLETVKQLNDLVSGIFDRLEPCLR